MRPPPPWPVGGGHEAAHDRVRGPAGCPVGRLWHSIAGRRRVATPGLVRGGHRPRRPQPHPQVRERQARGRLGCELVRRPVRLSVTGEIDIRGMVSTVMAGPDDAMRSEAAYMERLQQVEKYTFSGDTLTLQDTAATNCSSSPGSGGQCPVDSGQWRALPTDHCPLITIPGQLSPPPILDGGWLQCYPSLVIATQFRCRGS